MATMQRIRSVLFDVWLVLWTIAVLPAIGVLALMGSPARSVRRFTRVWMKGLVAGLKYIAGIRHQEKGRDNIPKGPCLFVANHQSMWETIVTPLLIPDLAIVAKIELSRIPVFAWGIRSSPMIMLDRNGGAKALRAMVADSRKALADGRSILIFPEGTRKGVAAPMEFRRGFELLYKALGVPVVPVAVNSGCRWGPELPYKMAGTITISYLPPVSPNVPSKEMSESVRLAIEKERDLLARAAGN